MAIRVTWSCDGCGEDADATNSRPSNWQKITVTLDGFSGYPVGDYANGERSYELCPSCQKQLKDNSNPRAWPRAKDAQPEITP